MSKVRLMIEIDEKILTHIKVRGYLKCDEIDNVRFALKYGTPITDDMISRSALKSELELSKYIVPNDVSRLLNSEINRCIEAVDNAPKYGKEN